MDIEAVANAVALSGQPLARQREGLDTVRKLLANVRDSPGQEKYRRIKKSTPAIQSRLFPQCLDLLRAAGFEDAGDQLLYRADPGVKLETALAIVESLLLSFGGTAAPPATGSSAPATGSSAPATGSASSPAAPAPERKGPTASRRAAQQQRQDREQALAERSQASAQEQLAALRQQRAGRYQDEQDTALARHLSGRDADAPYDAISALNAGRGAVSLITCGHCGCALRYSSSTRAQAVLCPCGMLLQPIHMRGQSFVPRSPSDLPVEPGVPVDSESRPRTTRGPFVTIQGPDGESMRVPLHSVLSMVRQNEERQIVGAEEDTIEALPTRKYAKDSGVAGEGSAPADCNCQICMEDFDEGDELRTLPCFHLFHAKCVDQWLKVNSICPTCRHKVG